jgi:hypothetical protein
MVNPMSLQKKLEQAETEQTELMCNLFDEILMSTKGIGPVTRDKIMRSLRERANQIREAKRNGQAL